ncbi:MAG: hypothetical protein V1816_18635 [Pseudomonadota bacterium]
MDSAAKRLEALGWDLVVEKKFRPLLGRYFAATANNSRSGETIEVEAATLKIALKKNLKRTG